MNKRILLIIAMILSVGLLGYGRAVLASPNKLVSHSQVGYAGQQEIPVSSLPGNDLRAPESAVLTETFKFLSTDPVTVGRYGTGVAVYEDTLVIGEIQRDNGSFPGKVYVYDRNNGGQNNWGLVKVLALTNSVDWDLFGYSISLVEDTLLVGAPTADGNVSESGAAYIYERHEGGLNNWGLVAELTASDGASMDQFGWMVDLNEDTAVIGSRWHDLQGENEGAVYIYERNTGGANNWGEAKKITASDGASYDRFGLSVAIDNDTLIVGATGQDDNGDNSGAAYIFERNTGGTGNWGEVIKFFPDAPAANDHFGRFVAINEDTVLVGAPEEGGQRFGSAYVFSRNEGGTSNWGQIAHLVPSDGEGGDEFGTAGRIEGETIIVSAQNGNGVTTNTGSVYIFIQDPGNPTQWNEVNELVSSDGAGNDWFGRDVDMYHETIIAGAHKNDDFCPSNPDCDSGAAYLFTPVLSTDIAIGKAVFDSTAVPGQPITYTLTFTNNGPDIAFGTILTDIVPALIFNPTFTHTGVIITATGSQPFVWQVANMALGTVGVITVTGIISPELISETTIVNTAVISTSQDITPTNNSSTAVTQVVIPQMNLSAADYMVNEDGGVVTVTAVLSPAQPFLDVSVAYETADGTATAGEDYTGVSGILTFTAGTTSAAVVIPVLDDQLVETDETFTVTLSNPVHALLGAIPTAIVTIADEDMYPELNFSLSDYTVQEDDGEVTLSVSLSQPYPEAVTVEYETSDDTAVMDEDYTAVSGILTFTAGMTITNIVVPILDDQLVETDETFTMMLGNPVHGILGGTAEATVLITDDDVFPAASLTTSNYLVPEGVGELIIEVQLSQPYPQPVLVSYQTVDDTAVAGEDYVSITGTLTFTPGTTELMVTIQVIDDSLVESAEAFSISLLDFVNATPQAPTTATITIYDNDKEPPISGTTIYLPIILRPVPTPPPPAFPIWISSGVTPQPVVSQGEVFYTATITIPAALPSAGQFFLSASSDDLLVISVDDELAFVLDGEDLFVKRFSLDGQTIYPEIVPLPRQTLALMAGQTVTVVFRDVFGDQVSATPIWLIWVP